MMKVVTEECLNCKFASDVDGEGELIFSKKEWNCPLISIPEWCPGYEIGHWRKLDE